MPRIREIFATIAMLATLSMATPATAQHCDRACLGNLVTTYVDAVLARDHSTLPVTPDVRVTENSRVIALAEGLFARNTRRGTFRHDYLDTTRQVAAAHVELSEDDKPVLLSVALHVEGGRIAGIESVVETVEPGDLFQPRVLGTPVRGLDDQIPAGQRMTREAMLAQALTYVEGLRVGSFIDSATQFAPETYRVENGVITAGEGCAFAACGMYEGGIMLHPSIIPSVVAIDEENGTVLLWMNFGDTGSYGPGEALVTFEAFKVWGGQIHAINAFFTFLPARMQRFWPSEEPLPRRF
ncbi:hypothetical protein M3P36_08835 [Altererythrobacter sp. KTW20L]|uniref:hypothetical protein n=1 Tax=Altererythrobacter sp. KTW20L TaxID=2942210 RepID=UPI0020BFB4A7|nr:hypothetical protein [Altererythrobacter sp. KTW20L]MCL6251146.1 hypothetical protein [Altererythrobacter sp. KTW20L]